jgi:metal-dependent HD superfamily phosphatase/phosphodiesterase
MNYESIRTDSEIKILIQSAGKTLEALGYTEHSFAHAGMVAERAGMILSQLGYDESWVDLAKIAGFLHDIGNLVNRSEHSQSGAVMAFQLLNQRGFPTEKTALIVSAIGNHDEGTGVPVNPIAAALILADKSDVRRSRVLSKTDSLQSDIHDRVNFSVTRSELILHPEEKNIDLELTVDSQIGSVMDYFEIFMERMTLCRKAAEHLGLRFSLFINKQKMT